MMKVRIEISLKDGVLDPQAKTISHSLHSLGYTSLKDVKIIKTMELDIDTIDREFALEQAKAMSESLLANPVIENYTIELES